MDPIGFQPVVRPERNVNKTRGNTMSNILLYIVIAVLAVTTITLTESGKKNAIRATELVEGKEIEIQKFVDRLNESGQEILNLKEELGSVHAALQVAERKAKADRTFVKAHLRTYHSATARGSRAEAVLAVISLNNLLQKPIVDQNGVGYVRVTDLKRYIERIKVRIGKLTASIGDSSL